MCTSCIKAHRCLCKVFCGDCRAGTFAGEAVSDFSPSCYHKGVQGCPLEPCGASSVSVTPIHSAIACVSATISFRQQLNIRRHRLFVVSRVLSILSANVTHSHCVSPSTVSNAQCATSQSYFIYLLSPFHRHIVSYHCCNNFSHFVFVEAM